MKDSGLTYIFYGKFDKAIFIGGANLVLFDTLSIKLVNKDALECFSGGVLFIIIKKNIYINELYIRGLGFFLITITSEQFIF